MQGKKHKPEQIIKKLREADAMLAAGKTIGQVAQALAISEQTFHRWRNQYGGMQPQQLRDNQSLRQHVATELSAVQATLDGLLVDRPRRNLLRRPR